MMASNIRPQKGIDVSTIHELLTVVAEISHANFVVKQVSLKMVRPSTNRIAFGPSDSRLRLTVAVGLTAPSLP